jgi:hypothetical protein
MSQCPECDRQFDTERGMRIHYGHKHDDPAHSECPECGETFRSRERKYCSEECRSSAVSYEGENNPHYQGGKDRTECDICGAEFEYYPSEKPGLYCSECVEHENWRHEPDNTGENSHLWSGGKQEFNCDHCEDTVERYPGRV